MKRDPKISIVTPGKWAGLGEIVERLPTHLHLLPFPALLLYIHRQHALLRQLQVCVSMSLSMFMTPPAGLPPPTS